MTTLLSILGTIAAALGIAKYIKRTGAKERATQQSRAQADAVAEVLHKTSKAAAEKPQTKREKMRALFSRTGTKKK